ncbi:MAG: protein kinase [Planctomycetia bacterium]|nr:protein kinase [Planctomycetia bacterium]
MIAEACLSDVEQFFSVLQKSALLDEETFEIWRNRVPMPTDARTLASVMVRDGVLTKYQGNRLLQGKYHGFVVGPYTILDLLVEGKSDASFLAWHHAMNRKVALKVVKQNLDHCKVTHERFMREARITATVNHPNIVKVFDFVEENGIQFLVMEYVEGKNLLQLIEANGPIAPAKAIEYICHAAAGLQHAHDQGIIHRDIKPSNLILNHKGQVKILDMGHSRFSDDETMNITKLYSPNSVMGTVEYIAPEQSLGQDYDYRCDIYSLGCTLFTLLAGRPPFQGNTYQLLMAHQVDEVPSLKDFQPGIPSALQSVINRMMAKQPSARYQSATEVIKALQAIASSRSAVVVPKLPTKHAMKKQPTQFTIELPVDLPEQKKHQATTGSSPSTRRHSSVVSIDLAAETTAIKQAAVSTTSTKTRRVLPWLILAGLAVAGVAGWFVYQAMSK